MKYASLIVYVVLVAIALSTFFRATEISSRGYQYQHLHEQDPIFALEGTDPDALAASYSVLFDMRDSMAEQFPRQEADSIRRALYPESFLRSLVALEKYRIELSKKPSRLHVEQYHAALMRTIALYKQDGERLAHVLATIPNAKRIAFLGGTATLLDMSQKISATTLSAAADGAFTESVRYRCYVNASMCGAVSDGKKAADVYALPSHAVLSNDLLVSGILQGYPEFVKSESLPLVSITSDCYRSEGAFMRAWKTSDVYGVHTRSTEVSDIFFHDIVAASTTSSYMIPAYNDMIEQGARFQFQPSANFYECPDAGYDSFTLHRALGVIESLREQRLFTDGSSLSNIENDLVSRTIITNADVDAYIKAINDFVHDHPSDARIPRIRSLTQISTGGSSKFDERIREAAMINAFVPSYMSAGGSLGLGYMFAARSYASLMFFFGNASFVTDPPSLFYDHKKYALDNFSLRSYNDDLSHNYTRSELISQAQETHRIMGEAGF